MEIKQLRINHPSPLIYCVPGPALANGAENQSSIPFDILRVAPNPLVTR